MTVLVTGAFGRVGTALIQHQRGSYEYRFLDREPHPDREAIVSDVSSPEPLETALEGTESVVHLAAASSVDSDWATVLQSNIIGTYNCLEACRTHDVESIVLASSNHVVGMYETEHAPEIYEKDYPLTLDHKVPVRPDSFYATSKVFTEALGRYYVENYDYPKHVYALRIGSVRSVPYDHPYGDAEKGVDDGSWERGSDEYQHSVRRLKATWHSRRDVAQMIERCLDDDDVTFDIFYGLSDNERRWFGIEHAATVLGYEPQDSAEEWTEPPVQSN